MLFIVYIKHRQLSVSLMLSTLILSTCSVQLHMSHSGTFMSFLIVSHRFVFVLFGTDELLLMMIRRSYVLLLSFIFYQTSNLGSVPVKCIPQVFAAG